MKRPSKVKAVGISKQKEKMEKATKKIYQNKDKPLESSVRIEKLISLKVTDQLRSDIAQNTVRSVREIEDKLVSNKF